METIKIEKGEDLVELVKCKKDEILFIRYDSAKDPELTSNLINDIMEACRKLDIMVMFLPISDEQVYIDLEQWDVARLRNFDNKLQEIIKKKSPLILS
jgi:hypothetical protein